MEAFPFVHYIHLSLFYRLAPFRTHLLTLATLMEGKSTNRFNSKTHKRMMDATTPAVNGDDGSPSATDHATGSRTIGTSSLDALQSKDSRKVMDIVDKLRRSGLSGIL